jgi:hypothetical protein
MQFTDLKCVIPRFSAYSQRCTTIVRKGTPWPSPVTPYFPKVKQTMLMERGDPRQQEERQARRGARRQSSRREPREPGSRLGEGLPATRIVGAPITGAQYTVHSRELQGLQSLQYLPPLRDKHLWKTPRLPAFRSAGSWRDQPASKRQATPSATPRPTPSRFGPPGPERLLRIGQTRTRARLPEVACLRNPGSPPPRRRRGGAREAGSARFGDRGEQEQQSTRWRVQAPGWSRRVTLVCFPQREGRGERRGKRQLPPRPGSGSAAAAGPVQCEPGPCASRSAP